MATILTMAFRAANWGRNMLMAIASWSAIFALFLVTSYAGPTAFTCLIAVIAFLAMNEYYRLTGMRSVPLIAASSGLLAATNFGETTLSMTTSRWSSFAGNRHQTDQSVSSRRSSTDSLATHATIIGRRYRQPGTIWVAALQRGQAEFL